MHSSLFARLGCDDLLEYRRARPYCRVSFTEAVGKLSRLGIRRPDFPLEQQDNLLRKDRGAATRLLFRRKSGRPRKEESDQFIQQRYPVVLKCGR